jgi:hypothetical protein
MIRRSVLTFALLLATLPAQAGFNEIMGDLHARLGSSMTIPMFGFVRTALRIGHFRGVHDLQLAVWEGKGSQIAPDELNQIVTKRMGRGYAPLVRVRSRHDREASFIYFKPHGELLDLIVLTNDGDDTVLVRVVVDPALIQQYLRDNPRDVAQVASR